MSTPPASPAVVEWVRASCAEQGVPEKVTDPAVLREVGVLLGAAGPGTRAHGAPAPRTRARPVPLHPPVR